MLAVGFLVLLGSQLAVLVAQAQASVAAPTFDPMGGNHTDLVIVTIETATPGAEIRYTFDPLGNAGRDTCTGNLEHIADIADASCESIFGVP